MWFVLRVIRAVYQQLWSFSITNQILLLFVTCFLIVLNTLFRDIWFDDFCYFYFVCMLILFFFYFGKSKNISGCDFLFVMELGFWWCGIRFYNKMIFFVWYLQIQKKNRLWRKYKWRHCNWNSTSKFGTVWLTSVLIWFDFCCVCFLYFLFLQLLKLAIIIRFVHVCHVWNMTLIIN